MKRILLVGMMGAGKSTVGRLLADRLGWDYLDSDAQIVAEQGRTVAEIFAADGESAFRAMETDVLRAALAGERPVVVSVAGGAVLDPANREILGRSGQVVWLRARTDTLAARVGDGTDRPLLAGDPAGSLERLDEVRRPLYQQIADVVVDVDDVEPHDVVERILEQVA